MSPQPRPPCLNVHTAEGVTVVQVAASDLDEGHIQAISEELLGLADGRARRRLKVDLAEVRYLTSTALGKFVALHKRVAAAGGRLALVNVAEAVYEIFDVSRLTGLLDVRRGPGDHFPLPASPPLAS